MDAAPVATQPPEELHTLRHRRRAICVTFVIALLPLVIASGCASSHSSNATSMISTTRLTSSDLQRMTDQMSASLVAAEVIHPGMVIAVDRVENLTNHIMSAADKDGFILSLRRALISNESFREEGVIFVESAARLPDNPSLRGGGGDAATVSGTGPTHALAATFLALTTQTRGLREDYYECQFRLFDLQTNRDLWIDAYPVRLVVARTPM